MYLRQISFSVKLGLALVWHAVYQPPNILYNNQTNNINKSIECIISIQTKPNQSWIVRYIVISLHLHTVRVPCGFILFVNCAAATSCSSLVAFASAAACAARRPGGKSARLWWPVPDAATCFRAASAEAESFPSLILPHMSSQVNGLWLQSTYIQHVCEWNIKQMNEWTHTYIYRHILELRKNKHTFALFRAPSHSQ